MILVDTSVWVSHLRKGNYLLSLLLEQGLVLVHPFIIAELACGSMANRQKILELLKALPCIGAAEHTEVLHLVEERRLYGQGIGWIDAHLLASALLSDSLFLTSDRKLFRVAESLGIFYHSGR